MYILVYHSVVGLTVDIMVTMQPCCESKGTGFTTQTYRYKPRNTMKSLFPFLLFNRFGCHITEAVKELNGYN